MIKFKEFKDYDVIHLVQLISIVLLSTVVFNFPTNVLGVPKELGTMLGVAGLTISLFIEHFIQY